MELTIIIMACLAWVLFDLHLVYRLKKSQHEAACWKRSFIDLSAKQIEGKRKWI